MAANGCAAVDVMMRTRPMPGMADVVPKVRNALPDKDATSPHPTPALATLHPGDGRMFIDHSMLWHLLLFHCTFMSMIWPNALNAGRCRSLEATSQALSWRPTQPRRQVITHMHCRA